MTLQEQREQASTTATASQAAIREKADAAKVERERALEQKAAVDAALAELEEQRQMFLTADKKLQEERMQAERNAAKAPAVRDEAHHYSREANAKYAEAQQKSEAWLRAKSEAQQHRQRWSDFWNQAKQAGDAGDTDSSAKFRTLEEKLAVVGQDLKNKLSPKDHTVAEGQTMV